MPRPPGGHSERTRGYVTLSRDSAPEIADVDQSLTVPVGVTPTQQVGAEPSASDFTGLCFSPLH